MAHKRGNDELGIMGRLYCISDAHLGAQDRATERLKQDRLLTFLDHVHANGDELIINGDLFDFWFEYRHAIPRLHFRILARLARIVDSGHPVHYMAGNHDFWLGSFMEQEIGLSIHPDEYTFEFDGRKYYVRHGDGLMKKDYLYRGLKRVLRSPVNIFLYRLLHPDFGVPLALLCSHQSRNASKKKTHYSDHDYRLFARERIRDGYDIVMLGHTHLPALEPYRNGWYLNAGNWMGAFTYIVVEDGIPALMRWNGQSGEPLPPTGSDDLQEE